MVMSSPARLPFPYVPRFPSRLERARYKCYNYLYNALYPVRPLYFAAAATSLTAYFARYDSSSSTLLKCARVGVVSLSTAYIPVLLIRLVLRHFYFKYKGWVVENPKKPSFKTKMWGMIRSLLSLSPPLLQSCDALLPAPAVPALEQTIARYLESIRQLHSKHELASIEKMAEDFMKGEAVKLQRCTKLYALFTDNYVTGLWEKFAYLNSRKPLLINSSVCHGNNLHDTPSTQAVKAAHVVHFEFQSQLAIDRQAYAPLASGLVCSRHYDKMYAVSRVPGEKCDRLHNYGIARHIVVFHDGGIYRVDVVDENDRIYSIDQLTDIFLELLARPGTKVEGAAARVAALTHDDRTIWHTNRRRFFESIPKNRKALHDIESAAMVFCLSAETTWGYDPGDDGATARFLKEMLVGDGTKLWVDKPHNYTIGRNGAFGGTVEHSVMDGSECNHVMESFVYTDNHLIGYPPLEEQLEKERSFDAKDVNDSVKFAERIEFDVTEEMSSEIDRCIAAHRVAAEDVDLASLVLRRWGKGRIKEARCSPDAFVQMAIQLANYRDQGRFVLTYEPTSARFFANSRTETLRTVTDESCEFVRAMVDGGATECEERVALLRRACELHSTHNKECMLNKGVDRHLFVLYVMAQATGTASPFLEHYVRQEWLLSTSCAPNVTNLVPEDEHPDQSFLGGAFGAVAKNGYGVSYRFAGNHSIIVHISSFHSANNTDSTRFRRHLDEALEEIINLFD